MKSNEQNSGKTLLHGAEAGEITAAMIEQRAHEIAVIAGRETTTAEDRRDAREELSGRDLPDTMSDDSAAIALSLTRDPSDLASMPGRQIPTHADDSDDDAIERLAIEGVEEAQHDQMLAARRQKNT